MPFCLISRFPVLQEIPRRTRFLTSYAFGAPAESPCCGVERRAQHHLTERSIPGARTRDHRSQSGSLLHLSQRHLKTTHCNDTAKTGVQGSLGQDGFRSTQVPMFLDLTSVGSGSALPTDCTVLTHRDGSRGGRRLCLRDGYAHVYVHSCATHDTPCCALCVVWHRLSARVVVCLFCAVARSRVQRCVAVLLRAGATAKSRYRSLSGSALPFPKGVTLIDPAARTVTVPHPGSHEHEVPSLSLSLESHVCQVAPRTCVRCPRASLSEGVTLRKLPVHRRWFEKEFVCNRGTLGVYAARPRAPVHCTARLHTLSYPMSTSGDFHPL